MASVPFLVESARYLSISLIAGEELPARYGLDDLFVHRYDPFFTLAVLVEERRGDDKVGDDPAVRASLFQSLYPRS